MSLPQPKEDIASKSGSNLERVLAAGHFAVTGELGPPKNFDTGIIKRKIDLLRGCVDAVNITDTQTAVVRMSSIATGILLVQEGLEPVIQMTCRDRNRLSMQSDLLGAAAHGVRNLLCLSGDHQSFGNHPGAKNVHDIDSIQRLIGHPARDPVDVVRKSRRTRLIKRCQILPPLPKRRSVKTRVYKAESRFSGKPYLVQPVPEPRIRMQYKHHPRQFLRRLRLNANSRQYHKGHCSQAHTHS